MTLDFKLTDKFEKFKSLKLTGGIIWALEKIYGKRTLDPKLAHLRTLPKGQSDEKLLKCLIVKAIN